MVVRASEPRDAVDNLITVSNDRWMREEQVFELHIFVVKFSTISHFPFSSISSSTIEK